MPALLEYLARADTIHCTAGVGPRGLGLQLALGFGWGLELGLGPEPGLVVCYSITYATDAMKITCSVCNTRHTANLPVRRVV